MLTTDHSLAGERTVRISRWRSYHLCDLRTVLPEVYVHHRFQHYRIGHDTVLDRFLHARTEHTGLGKGQLPLRSQRFPRLKCLFRFQIFNMKPNPTPPPCWGGVILCCWPISSVLGVLVQCFVTAWKIDHRRQLHHRRRRHYKGRSGSRSRETREEARQRKYRYLYQVRTARGDIISQVSGEGGRKTNQPAYGSGLFMCKSFRFP